jgi:hypothetical protein
VGVQLVNTGAAAGWLTFFEATVNGTDWAVITCLIGPEDGTDTWSSSVAIFTDVVVCPVAGYSAFRTDTVDAGGSTGDYTVYLRANVAAPGAVRTFVSRVTDGVDALNITAVGEVGVAQATASNLNAEVQGDAATGTAKSGKPVQTGAVFNTTQPTVTTGQVVENQATARGAQIVATGVDAFTVSGPLTDAQLRATAVPVSGTVTIGVFPDNEPINVAQMAGTAVSMNTGVRDAGTQRVTIATNDVVPASQSGTWTVQPGNTANTTSWLVKEQRAATPAVTSVADSAASVTCLASNVSRLGATVYNDSTADLYAKFGATASTTSFTVKVFQDGFFTVPFGYTGIIDCIWSADTAGSARVTEVTQ